MSHIEFDINGKTLFEEDRHKVSIMRCCEEYCSPNKKKESRMREYYSLHFIICGHGTLRYKSEEGEVEVDLKKGDSFLLYEGEQYEYFPDSVNPWGYDWIDFTGENVEDLFHACGYDREKPYVTIRHFDLMRSDIKELVEEFDASDLQNIKCSAYFMLLLSRMIDNCKKHINRESGAESRKIQRMRSVLIFMNNNYRLDLDVDTIARSVYISSDYLKHIFPELLGMMLSEYLMKFRISSACERINRNPYIKIEDVAAEVGYGDPKYFVRAFKKIVGMSASEYRKTKHTEDPFLWLKEKNIDFR